ncbi:helix-turn-helix domain-containing protein [Cryptosporangium phraense]|uniref:Helix-turn-helix domain-containing protein n=1 Tax=Cryptosporangium phraense TaxID=2593070 RepID=A0A545AX19_9ACTN|nr:XRE family transcriptional regulator [Cryptosporangium phraense]TQS45872.1 helix-turn-helix domain-containing protein [Cryptosporangium phraense]
MRTGKDHLPESGEATGDKDALARDVGAIVRAQRVEAGISIAELARRVGVSGPFISQLEAGRSSLSLPTLYRIGSALGVAPSALLPGSSESALVTRSGHGMVIPATATAATQRPRLITRPGPGHVLEGYHYVIRPDDDPQQWYEHQGEDVVYVVAGAIAVEFEDGREVMLQAGDALHHDGDVAHRWRLLGSEPAEAIVVNTVHT